jgi:probable F420-dependent oxidoreductase
MESARVAEDLGFSDVWVNDHIGFAADTNHPSPRMYEPLSCLALATAVTKTIGIGSQITAPYYPPVYLAKSLSSLDSLSGGRLKIAIGVGWQKAEFDVLESDFATRGKRTDEIIAILRSCWTTGSSEFKGSFYQLPALKISPPPAHDIPIWIAGTTPPAFHRAVTLGDGYHGQPTRREGPLYARQNAIADLPSLVRQLRASRPDDASFCISMYTHEWDPADTEGDLIRREWDFFAQAGVQHVVAAFHQRDGASWIQSIRDLARILQQYGT